MIDMPDRTRGIRSVSGRTLSFWWGCGVFLLAVLPFLPSAGYPFLVEWDDGRFVLFNDRLLPSLENALHLATHTFQTLYTPLPMLSLMVDRFFFGTLPAGYHWHNLLLHGVSALLLFQIFRRLEVRDWIAAAGALLWAVLRLRDRPWKSRSLSRSPPGRKQSAAKPAEWSSNDRSGSRGTTPSRRITAGSRVC